MNPNKAYTWRRGTRKKAKAMGFWPFSKAASATAPTLATLLETGTTSTGSYAPRTMRSLAQQGYLANPTVFRAVNIIAQTTASIPLQVFQTGKKRVKLESHPLLSQLNKPNEEQTRASFIEKLVSYWLIAGTAYIFGSFSSPRRPPAGLFPLRPDLTEMVLNSDNSINHYTYAVGSTIYTYIPWQVRPIRSFHPLDDFYGASPLSVAWAVIERQNEGELWNYSLIKHAARPSGAFVSSVNLSDISRLTLKREIDEKYRGAKKAGTPLLLEGGLSYVQLSLSPTDMDWIQADAGASRKLAMAIGVDPLLLNDKEHSTYNNVKEARLALIDITSLPLLSRFVDELNVWLAPYYGSDIEIAIDEDYLARLRDDKQTSSSIAINGFNAGTHTLNEARAIQGLDVLDDGDFMKLGPQIYVRISEIADFLTQQAERRAAPPVAPPQIAPPKTPPQKIDALLSRLEQKATHDESQESYIRQVEERRASFTPAVQDSLAHFFRNQHTRVLAAIKTVKSIEQAKTVASTTIDSMTTELFDIFLLHYTAISSSFAEYTGQLLKTHTTIFTKEVAQDFLKQAEAAVESIQNTTKKRVERIIEEGRKHVNVKDFDGYDWVCSDLDDIFAGFLEERAEDIADQVVCDASNLGNYWAARNTGLPLKHTWLATLDEKTREDHRTASGQTQYLEMPYEVGYDHWMLFPGDKSYSAPISEWANCRCTEWYALDEAPQDNPYYQERLRQREVAGKSRLPFLRWAKFNPYHDNLGRFAHTPAGLAPPGQPALPGLDPWTDINVEAFQQPQLMPRGKPVKPPKEGRVESAIPVEELGMEITLEKMREFGDPDSGDNPRFTVDVAGQKYFVKRLEGRVMGGAAEDFVTHELAARDMAVRLGLDKQTVPVATFEGEDGSSYLAQPFMKGRKDAYSMDDPESVVYGIPDSDYTKMVAYEYLAGTQDRHGGQYLIDPEDKEVPIKLIDFDYGFPEGTRMDSMSWLMQEDADRLLDTQALRDLVSKKKDVLTGLKDSGLQNDQLDSLADRFDALASYVDSHDDYKGSVRDFYVRN